MKKFISLILLSALVLSQLACTQQEDIDSETTASDSLETTTTTPETTTDNLPSDLDFGGETVNILYRNELLNEFYVEEDTGDIVDSAVYNSIKNVEERLNVTINVTARDGYMASARDDYNNHIINSVLADDDQYDWVDMLVGLIPAKLTQGVFADLCEVDYIDIEQPWYLKGTEDMMIDDKLYFISGDSSLGYIKSAYVIFFNPEVVENYHIENLYTLVDEGKWTLDKVAELAQIASEDLNGDSVYDENDKLGFLVHNYNHLAGFYSATDTHMYEKDSDGNFQFVFGSERDAGVCEKLYQVLYNTVGSFDCNLSDTTESEVQPFNVLTNKFISGDILMMTAQLDESIQYLRNMETYGILPYPKYDEEQENYYTISRSAHSAFAMPVTCDDRDMAGAVMEALSSEKYRTVLPKYFETALKVKYSHDDDTGRMLDIIRDSMVFNFEFIFNHVIGSPVLDIFRKCYSTENAFASILASNKTMLETKIGDYIEEVIDANS